MICRISQLCLRIATTLLVVLGLLAPAQMQAAMPFTGPLMAVEICHDDQTLTIWLDADGNERPAPHDCRDCDFCGFNTPVLPAFILGLARQAAGRPLAALSHPEPVTLRPDYQIPPLRGPPSHYTRIASA